MEQRRITCTAIPTSLEVELTCSVLGIRTTSLIDAKPDWAFDGADEVDPNGDVIKGRGGAMFREKLLIDSAPRTYILVDQSKLVQRLGERFHVPIEVYPAAANLVTQQLYAFGVEEIDLRLGVKKDGPVITENGNIILDVKFSEIRPDFERRIKRLEERTGAGDHAPPDVIEALIRARMRIGAMPAAVAAIDVPGSGIPRLRPEFVARANHGGIERAKAISTRAPVDAVGAGISTLRVQVSPASRE